eukprot:215573_1
MNGKKLNDFIRLHFMEKESSESCSDEHQFVSFLDRMKQEKRQVWPWKEEEKKYEPEKKSKQDESNIIYVGSGSTKEAFLQQNCGKDITLEGNKVIHSNNHTNTAYGSVIIDFVTHPNARYKWTLKSQNFNDIIIGIATNFTAWDTPYKYNDFIHMHQYFGLYSQNGGAIGRYFRRRASVDENMSFRAASQVSIEVISNAKTIIWYKNGQKIWKRTLKDGNSNPCERKYKLALALSATTVELADFEYDDFYYPGEEITLMRCTIKSLQTELNDTKKLYQSLLEKHEQEEKQNKPEKTLKEHLIFMADKMNEFNVKYNQQKLQEIYSKDMNDLFVELDIDNTELSAKSMIKILKNVKNYVLSVTKPDASKYKDWDVKIAIIWIKSLDGGHFAKYCDTLRNGFESDGIAGEDLPNIVAADLAVAPFHMRQFKDRKRLAYHFKSLREGDQIASQNKEGSTQYI